MVRGDMTMHTTSLAPSIHPGISGEAVIDLDAIAHNVRLLREHAGTAEVMAVVKADGYGHGASQVGQAALAAGAAELGVATIGEALELRRAGITAPVLAWLHPPGADFAPALSSDVQIGVSSLRQVADLLDAVERTGLTAVVTIKVDTGLNRNGVSARDYPDVLDVLARATAAGAVRVRGIMSHLACGDEPENPVNDRQAQRFAEMLHQAGSRGVDFEVAHLSNSPSAMTRPDLGFDMVRPGVAVYGLSPIPEFGDMGLRPAMTLRDSDTTVALIPLGYADGVFRALGGRIDVLINGRLRRSVGRMCMDQFVVDLGPEVDVSDGDEAILFGPGLDGEPTAADWAELLGTIHYEIVTSPRGRVRRTYIGGDHGGR